MRIYDPFRKIPSPLLLTIVKLLPDLTSLLNLDKASPIVASLFDECGAAEIFESVASTNLCEQVQNLIRIAVIVRSNTIPSKTWADFLDTYLSRDFACKQYNNGNICVKETGPRVPRRGAIHQKHKNGMRQAGRINQGRHKRSDRGLDSCRKSIFRDILVSANRIQQLTYTCLQTMINRCADLKPSHLDAPNFQYLFNLCGKRSPQRRPTGRRYAPKNIGPPTWVEEERAMRAFWRLQVFFDLKTTMPSLGWPGQDLAELHSMDAETFGAKERCRDSSEHVKTVLEYLAESYGVPASSYDGPPGPRSSLPVPRNDFIPRSAEAGILDSYDIDSCTVGVRFIASHPQSFQDSPLKHVDFNFYRRLGFYIWSAERMDAMGFINAGLYKESPELENRLSRNNLHFTWESILGDEQLAKMEWERIQEFPEDCREFGSCKEETYWTR